MLPSVHHLTSDHTTNSVGYTLTNSASQYSSNQKPTHFPSMVSKSDKSNSTYTAMLPSIHHLTNQAITDTGGLSQRLGQSQMPQQLPFPPSAYLATPLPTSQLVFEQHHYSTHVQPPYPISLMHTQQLHQLRLPVNKQYIFTQNSPASPISPNLSPYFATQQPDHSYSPPFFPLTSFTSPPIYTTSSLQNLPARQLSLPGRHVEAFQQTEPRTPKQVQEKASANTLTDSRATDSAKITKPPDKSVRRRRRRRKSAPNTASSKNLHQKTVSLIYTRKPRQTLVFDEKAIHFPVYKDLSRLIQSNKIPATVVEQLNTSIYPSIDTKKYSTSALDAQRNFLTVFEYMVNDHWVIWDYETGFVHLTGIWKASLNAEGAAQPTASHSKADIVKLLESTPKQYQAYIKRIRGGFLKIQGTWLPYKLCRILARRFCYHIRFALIPIFGADFPEECLHPNDPGYGELRLDELQNYQHGNLPETEKVKDLSCDSRQPGETKTTTTASFVGQLPPSESQQVACLASPVRMSSSGFAKGENVDQLPAIGTFSPVSASAKVEKDTKQYTTRPTGAEEERHQSPLDSATHYNKFGEHASTSTSSESLSSIFTQNSAAQPIIPSNVQSYNDLLDIVNASRCLQSLKREQGNLKVLKTPIESCSQSSVEWEEEETDDELDEAPQEHPSRKEVDTNDDGISSILIAAELNKSFAYNSNLRTSISIKDLTT